MTVEKVKQYLRIDYEDEDEFIQLLIDSTNIYVDTVCGIAYKQHEHLVRLSEIAKLKLISDMYEKRSADADIKNIRDITITTIFETLSHAEVI